MVAGVLSVPRFLLGICADAVFPPLCNACNAPLLPGESIACQACRGAIVSVDEWDDAYRDALVRLGLEGTVADFVAAWYFERDSPLRELMHRLKYGGMTPIGVEFGRVLGERIREAGRGESGVIVPLPLHPSRMRERGFDQCACIARGVSTVTGRPVDARLIRRVRFTASQTTLGHGERRENVRGAFALRPHASVAGMTILLVDDVVTTGSTMRACASVLLGAGARSVIACAVAIAR
jgi:ComF family protein